MEFNEYKEEITKLTDLSSGNQIIIPEKHTWLKVEEDESFHTVNYYLPFDMYYIPRSFSNKFATSYKNKVGNAVYILSGNGKRYCGKAMNGDRIKNHNKDKEKGDWQYQLLFVPNNNHTGAQKYWNISFMDLLETKLIEGFKEYFDLDSEDLMNKVNGITKEKAMKNLNFYEDYEDFANIVVEYIIKAYVNFSKDNFLAINDDNEEVDDESKFTKAKNFRFYMTNIKVGEFVQFDPTGVNVKVESLTEEKCISYDGKKWSLTGFTREFIPDNMRCQSDRYQGTKFFSYNGKKLTDLREENNN